MLFSAETEEGAPNSRILTIEEFIKTAVEKDTDSEADSHNLNQLGESEIQQGTCTHVAVEEDEDNLTNGNGEREEYISWGQEIQRAFTSFCTML